MKTLIYLFLAVVSAIVFVYAAYNGVQEWNRSDAVAEMQEDAYTGETKGRKIAQESYIKYWFHLIRYYRATFEYEVDGKTYQAEVDSGLEPWDEEEVHYVPDDPATCYVGQFPSREDESGDYFGTAVVAGVMAAVFGAGALGFY